MVRTRYEKGGTFRMSILLSNVPKTYRYVFQGAEVRETNESAIASGGYRFPSGTRNYDRLGGLFSPYR